MTYSSVEQTFATAQGGSEAKAQEPRLRVWDPVVRIVHWGLAGSVLIAFLTEDEWLDLHVYAGYTAAGLLALRIVWGFVGSRHARFADFVRGPRATLAYLRDILRGHPRRYLGHNPAGAAMAVALIGGFGATVVTGAMALAGGDFAGPLAPWLSDMSPAAARDLKEVHEAIAWSTLFLVPFHLIGVAAASLQHKENLVRSMIDGHKYQ